jgi:hypothetical protein
VGPGDRGGHNTDPFRSLIDLVAGRLSIALRSWREEWAKVPLSGSLPVASRPVVKQLFREKMYIVPLLSR